MLNEFFKFFNLNEEFDSTNLYDDFCKRFSQRTFGDGLFNTFAYEKRDYWNSVIGKFYPPFKDKVEVIGYDWLGRIFTTLKDQDCVLLFEIGTGQVLNVGCSVENFIGEEIPVRSERSLAYSFFDEWKKENSCGFPYGSCVGYKIPLFLGGKDIVSNLEVSDMDVYWTVTGSLLGRKE